MAEEIKSGDNFLQVDGLRIHIRSAGNGKALILLHGLGGPLMLQRLVEPLANDFRVLVVDLPGFGGSGPPGRPLSTGDLATFLTHLLESALAERTVLAGVSYGGQLAVELATMCPQRLEALVLIASTGLAHHRSAFVRFPIWPAFSFIAKSTVLQSERLMCRLGSRSFHDIGKRPQDLCREFYLQLCRPGARDGWLNMLRNIYAGDPDFPEKLAQVRVPTAIVWGADDTIILPSYAQEFSRLLPAASLTIIPGCGHSVPLEKPDEVCRLIRSLALQG